MAFFSKRNYGKRNYGNRNYKKRSRRGRYTEQEKIAYRMGQVQRGLKNPDSKISASYNKGFKPSAAKPKKSLY